MTERHVQEKSRFEAELEKLEKAVGVPVVPGELRNWCLVLKDRLDALIGVWGLLERTETVKLEEILETDLALAHRVKALQEKRRELSERLHGFGGEIQKLLAQDAEDPEGSWEPTDASNQLREELLDWIVRCRAHDKEVETWALEAVHRDRGDVD